MRLGAAEIALESYWFSCLEAVVDGVVHVSFTWLGLRKSKKEDRNEASEQESETLEVLKRRCLDRWSPEKFVEFCVFCGTDYKDPDTHIKNFGIKTAFSLMSRHARASDVIQWMVQEKRFRDRFPCEKHEYESRFRRVVAVFWHHVVFNATRGMCTSIASSFPLTQAARRIEGMNLEEVCGLRFEKQEAMSMARGQLDPRTRLAKSLEPLTRAERRTIDLMLADKRSEQAEYKLNEKIKAIEEAEMHEKEEEAKVQEVDVQPEVPPEEEVDKEIRLLPGDLQKFQKMMDFCKDSKVEAQPVREVLPSNPFRRKRIATPCHGARGPQPVLKRQKLEALPAGKFEDLAPHIKGGRAAKEAAHALLAQRGLLQVKRDNNLKGFFGKPSQAPEPKPSKLSSWKPRSWEEDAEQSSGVGKNLLSLHSGRNLALAFRSRS